MSNQTQAHLAENPQATRTLSSLQPGDYLGYHPTQNTLRALTTPIAPNLRKLLDDKVNVPIPQKMKALRSLLRLLDSAHNAGVVHRSVRPESIYLAEDGEVFVGGWEQSTLFLKSLPAPNQYSAPELVRKMSDQIDARADLFSVGAVWYEWLTGAPPFTFDSPLKYLREASSGATPPKERNPDCPDGVSSFCLSLLSADREKRPFSVMAALGYLESSIEESDQPKTSRDEVKSEAQGASAPQEKKPEEDAIGREIGSYRVTGILGKGGMGVVYQAIHPGIGKKVAVKLLHARYSNQPETVMRFFREAKAVNEIHHENVIDVLDFGKLPSGECYIIMEHLDGKPLTALVKNKEKIPLSRLGHIMLQVCSALEAAHRRGIIHRDLKPDNVFLITRSARPDFVKLLDFGIAKLLYDDDVPIETNTGALIGTPLYMSPEQALGRKIDHQSDIYSLGILLYQLTTGEPPFYDNNPISLAMKHVTKEAKPPREINPELSSALNDVILRCMAKEKTDRYQTMLDVAQAIGEACGVGVAPYVALLPDKTSELLGAESLSLQDTMAPGETSPRASIEVTNPLSHQETIAAPSKTPQETFSASTGEVIPRREPKRAMPLGAIAGALSLAIVVAALFGLGVIQLGTQPPLLAAPLVSKEPETKPAATTTTSMAVAPPATTPLSQPIKTAPLNKSKEKKKAPEETPEKIVAPSDPEEEEPDPKDFQTPFFEKLKEERDKNK
jgi:serine/threonine protein kinase